MTQHPFINVTEKGENFTAVDCEFVGDRPTIKTAAKNTTLIRIRHSVKNLKGSIKGHPYLTGIFIVMVGLVIEYTFFA